MSTCPTTLPPTPLPICLFKSLPGGNLLPEVTECPADPGYLLSLVLLPGALRNRLEKEMGQQYMANKIKLNKSAKCHIRRNSLKVFVVKNYIVIQGKKKVLQKNVSNI